uniref:Uncharacterized protein n=1 Tax=Anguilla anguilla TaxID=7936 RepID=A0A0E9VGZ6_ANGAN
MLVCVLHGPLKGTKFLIWVRILKGLRTSALNKLIVLVFGSLFVAVPDWLW